MLAGLPAFAWDSARSVSYEVAVEAISQAAAAYTVLIQHAQHRGDTAEAERLRTARTACSRERDRLDGADDAAVRAATATYRMLTEDLRARVR
ncbi:hypothetical protein KRMM14A1259_00570 [Krasilnikovia sp. MM14-A1259]